MGTKRAQWGGARGWSTGSGPLGPLVSALSSSDLMTHPQLLNIREYLPNSIHTPLLAIQSLSLLQLQFLLFVLASKFLLTLFPVFRMLFLPLSPRSNTQTLVIPQGPICMHPSLMSLTADDISLSEFSQPLVHTSLRAYSITPPAVSMDCYPAQHLSSF